MRTHGSVRDRFHLAAGRKGRAAASDELRRNDFCNDAVGTRFDGATQREVSAVRAIVVDALRVDVTDATQ